MSTRKALLFLISVAAAIAMSFGPLNDLLRNGRPPDYYTHIPLIPAISAYVLFRRRKQLFRGEPGSLFLGLAVMMLGAGLFIFDKFYQPELIAHAELCGAGSILFLSGSYVALFGKSSFRRALFPFVFLVFVIPLPIAWMEHVVSALVAGSIGVTHLLFKAFGVPFVQEGSVFYLPAFGLEVAQECSGIRSSLALVITSVLAGQIFLTKPWKKIVLVMAVFPVTIFKNGVRIVTLYLLSYFVDMRIIEGGFLHKSGGFIFFGLGLVMLGYVLWLLRNPGNS
ncbi:MAG: exosortase [Syntrophobacterales bacterium]|nr:MAG: exosortase [Syntrophobacterales bacterium]